MSGGTLGNQNVDSCNLAPCYEPNITFSAFIQCVLENC